MLQEIRKQQQDLLGADASKCSVEFLSDTHQRHGKALIGGSAQVWIRFITIP